MSKSDAIEDTNALYVESGTDGTISNATLQAGQQQMMQGQQLIIISLSLKNIGLE